MKNEQSFYSDDFYNQTIVGIVLLVSLQVLTSVKPIFFCYYINCKDMTCHESPKLVFLSTYDKFKLKNDATYEGIYWDVLHNFCSSPFLTCTKDRSMISMQLSGTLFFIITMPQSSSDAQTKENKT
jgi:hypothetical protein